jgi:hypothetical protein
MRSTTHHHQARTGRGIHGPPKVSPGPAMPDPSTPVFFPLGYPFPYGPDHHHPEAQPLLSLQVDAGEIVKDEILWFHFCDKT